MHCRHCKIPWEYDWEHCPSCHRNFGGAVYPEQQTAEELVEIESLIDVITIAFEGVPLGDGTTIHEADLEGCYTHEDERLAARAKDTETSWLEVPDWKIEHFSAALSFLDIKGWLFYIPAYMIWTLKNWRTNNSITSDSVIWKFDLERNEASSPRFEVFSADQSVACYQFVKFFCDYSGDKESRHAMKVYWHQFAPSDA